MRIARSADKKSAEEATEAKSIINNITDINAADHLGRTLLTYLCFVGNMVTVEMAISKGANINHRDNTGSTGLIIAAMRGNAEVCIVLLFAGADLIAVNDANESALNAYGKMLEAPYTMGPETIERHRLALTCAWAMGSHPSQVERRGIVEPII
jgi:ankyrin repeat protein